MRYIIGIIVVVGLAWFLFMNQNNTPQSEQVQTADTAGVSEVHEIVFGTYTVDVTESTVRWAGQKPLVEGYINAGALALSGGDFTISEEAVNGSFAIDMNTLSVSETPKKPGKESALEEHLKGSRWFDVDTYPQATFTVTESFAAPDASGVYEVTGDLTMKGETHAVTFPVRVTQLSDGVLRGEAQFAFDRTKWGITAGSGSFFDNLADNIVADMVQLQFSIIAQTAI